MNNLLVSVTLLMICIVASASSLTCYFCENCPVPFNPYAVTVTQARSSSGYCAKKSTSSVPGALAGRGPAELGLCSWSGCRWIGPYYTCCCGSNLCNTGSLTSKSTITVLLGALALLAIKRYL